MVLFERPSQHSILFTGRREGRQESNWPDDPALTEGTSEFDTQAPQSIDGFDPRLWIIGTPKEHYEEPGETFPAPVD
jgi:hypothetical protein